MEAGISGRFKGFLEIIRVQTGPTWGSIFSIPQCETSLPQKTASGC